MVGREIDVVELFIGDAIDSLVVLLVHIVKLGGVLVLIVELVESVVVRLGALPESIRYPGHSVIMLLLLSSQV
jgi:hypothetical protein